MKQSFISFCATAAFLANAIVGSPIDKIFEFYRRADETERSVIETDIPIHSSCNASQTMQLKRGLFDTKRLAREASDHILQHGNSSNLFQTYFGNEADPAIPLGIYERILEGDKTGTLFRCDDIDRNCATQEGYNGHWRGSNATEETVICELSFQTRLPLEKACSYGFKLGRDNVNIYWGTDLLHRMMHIPKITNGFITHVADTHEDMVKLAVEKPDLTVKNQHSIQEFAFDVWSRKYYDERGCNASEEELHSNEDDHNDSHNHSNSTASSTAPVSTSSPSTQGQDCHTHADGTSHCV